MTHKSYFPMKFKKIASFSGLLPRLVRKPIDAGMAQQEAERPLPSMEQKLGIPTLETDISMTSESTMLRNIACLQTERAQLMGKLDYLLQDFCFRIHSRVEMLENKPALRYHGSPYRLDTVKTLIRPDRKGIDVTCYAVQECLSPTEDQENEVEYYRQCLSKHGFYNVSAERTMVIRYTFQLELTPRGPIASQLLNMTDQKGNKWLQNSQIGWPTAEKERDEIALQVGKLMEIESSINSLMCEYLGMAIHSVTLALIRQGGIEKNGHCYTLLGSTLPHVDFSRGRGDASLTIHLVRDDWQELDLESHHRRYLERLDGCTNISRESHASELVRQGIVIEVPYQSRWMPKMKEFQEAFMNSVRNMIPQS